MQPDRRNTIILVALSALLAFAFQGSRGLYETTEGRYAESAREMLETGNWLVPQLDYEPHWTKPPLAYWTIAAGMAIIGTNEWGARLGGAVVFVLIVLAVRSLARLMWDERTGFVSGIIYAISPFPLLAASSTHADLFLAFWELLAVLCYRRAFGAIGTRSEKRRIIVMWAFFGIAFLTKGPAAFVTLIALAAFHVYLAFTGRARPALFHPAGIFLMLAIGASSLIVVVARTQGLLGHFLRDGVSARIMTSEHGRNAEWYKPLVIFVLPLLAGAGPAMAAWIVELVKNGALFGRSSLRRLLGQDERLAFLAIWLLLPLAIFSLSKNRLPLNVLPIFPAVIFATARVALRALERPGIARAARVVAVVTAAALIACKGFSAYYRTDLDMRALQGACMEASRGRTAFYLYGSGGMFGLQFYLDGRLTRIADEPLPDHARRSLDAVCHEIIARPRNETYVFVVNAIWRGDILRRRFDELGLRYTVRDSGNRYMLFICTVASPSSILAMAPQAAR